MSVHFLNEGAVRGHRVMPGRWDSSFVANPNTPSNLLFQRNSDGTFFNAATVLNIAATDIPRFDTNPETLAARGLLLEGARTNLITNSILAGAATGVIGSGGALPTGFVQELAAGLTTTVTNIGTELGFAYVEFNLSGTATGTAWVIRTGTLVTGTIGNTYTASVYGKDISGKSSVNDLTVQAMEASGAFPSTTVTIPSASSIPARGAATRTLTIGGAQQLRIRVVVTNGNSINYTFRIYQPQYELGAFASSAILTSGITTTRAIDLASISNLASIGYNPNEGTFLIEWEFEGQVQANAHHILNINDGTTTGNTIIYKGLTSNSVTAVIDGQQSGVISSLSGGVYKAALAYKSGDNEIYVNGTSIGNTGFRTATLSTTQTQLNIGNRAAGDRPLFGWIRRITYYPFRLPNTRLQAISV